MLLSQLVVKLLLIVEEEEFIFENIRAAHFHCTRLFDFSFDSLQGLSFLLQLCLLLKLSEVHFLSHLLQMCFQHVLISKLIAESDLLSKLENV